MGFTNKAPVVLASVTVLATTLLSAFPASAGEERAAASNRNGRIAYVISGYDETSGDYERDIYAVEVGGDPIQLTDSPEGEGSLEWSPNGSKIAFTRWSDEEDGDEDELNTDIYVMRADGSHVTQITDHSAGEWSPTWSPNGRKLAFISDRGDDIQPRVFMIRSDGSSRKAKKVSDMRVVDIDWSPTAPVLAMASQPVLGRRGLQTLNLRTGKLEWITPGSKYILSVDWSPTGKAVAYWQVEDESEARIIHADGTHDRLVPTSGVQSESWATESPTWSPDGKSIAYAIVGTGGPPEDPYDTPYELRAVTLKGGKDVSVTVAEAGAFISGISWQPLP